MTELFKQYRNRNVFMKIQTSRNWKNPFLFEVDVLGQTT